MSIMSRTTSTPALSHLPDFTAEEFLLGPVSCLPTHHIIGLSYHIQHFHSDLSTPILPSWNKKNNQPMCWFSSLYSSEFISPKPFPIQDLAHPLIFSVPPSCSIHHRLKTNKEGAHAQILSSEHKQYKRSSCYLLSRT